MLNVNALWYGMVYIFRSASSTFDGTESANPAAVSRPDHRTCQKTLRRLDQNVQANKRGEMFAVVIFGAVLFY